jgi:hypothetical protein
MPITAQDVVDWLQSISDKVDAVSAKVDAFVPPPANVVYFVESPIQLLGAPRGVVSSGSSFDISYAGEAPGVVSVSLDSAEKYVLLQPGESHTFTVSGAGPHRVDLFIDAEVEPETSAFFIVG